MKAIDKYHQRILFLHAKDVRAKDDAKGYQWVELGRGRVDFPAVFAALKRHQYRGWVIVELDSVPDEAGTPKQSAEISKRYIRGQAEVDRVIFGCLCQIALLRQLQQDCGVARQRRL